MKPISLYQDVTNGSKLPFRLIPSAPTSSLLGYSPDGDVLIGGMLLEIAKGWGGFGCFRY
ncbi:MAG: hypothetical protein R2825_13120 [Saprospiraceae bacterium]